MQLLATFCNFLQHLDVITIIDYGMGNLRSVEKAFEKFYSNVIVSSSPDDVLKAEKAILPGVGAFKNAMDELDKRGLIGPIKSSIEKGKPFLGICLGLQLLFSESEEGGRIKGLDIVKGMVKRFDEKKGLKVPHMGWNRIKIKKAVSGIPSQHDTNQRLLGTDRYSLATRCKSKVARDRQVSGRKIMDGVKDRSFMYFVHSYYVEPEDKDVILCETDYGRDFVSGIHRDNIYAFQFHPEKSQGVGLKIIENFVKL